MLDFSEQKQGTSTAAGDQDMALDCTASPTLSNVSPSIEDSMECPPLPDIQDILMGEVEDSASRGVDELNLEELFNEHKSSFFYLILIVNN